MRHPRLHKFAWRLGRAVGFAVNPVMFFLVAYWMWRLAEFMARH